MATDPYAKIAKPLNADPYAQIATGSELPSVPKAPIPAGLKGPSSPNVAGGLLAAGKGAGDLLLGAGRGLYSTMSAPAAYAAQKLQNVPGIKIDPNKLGERQKISAPANTTQAVGKGIEQAGEFLIPGSAEEKAVSLLPKIARPVGRIAASALSSGAVNKLQGGDFDTGAAAGGIGAGIGAGLKALAPAVAEGALNIRKLDRAYGKGGGNIGRAILNETRGVRPSTVAESAEQRLSELNPQLNAAADRASVRQAPRIAGFLEPPREEIPLAPSPSPRNPKSRPMSFPAQVNPEEPMESRSGNPMADISEYPGINPHYLSGSEHPELSGRVTPIQNPQQVTTRMGVLLRRPEMSASIPRTIEVNPSASLRSGRGVLSSAAGTATRQGERTTLNQLQPMGEHLSERIGGEHIPENITPRQLLDLKRGFGNEFIHRWNPETMTGVKGTAAQTYHEMGQEFNRVVPEGAELNSRISNLIPVAKRASSEELNAPTTQRALHRIAAHTGALTGAGIGGTVGYREGGIPGAIAGGIGGIVAPELIASPTGEMAVARLLNKARSLRPLVGAGLVANRNREGK